MSVNDFLYAKPKPVIDKSTSLIKAERAINDLKCRGYEDAKNIAIVLEYIMEKLK